MSGHLYETIVRGQGILGLSIEVGMIWGLSSEVGILGLLSEVEIMKELLQVGDIGNMVRGGILGLSSEVGILGQLLQVGDIA